MVGEKDIELIRKKYPRDKFLIWDSFVYNGRKIFTIGGPVYYKHDPSVFTVELKNDGSIEIFDFWEVLFSDPKGLNEANRNYVPIDVKKEDR